jgi:uncharacterized protein YbaP (TraB family)
VSGVLKSLALSLVLALAALPARAQPPVWVVRDADSTIVIFGSVHLLPPGLDWRPAALDAALKDADDLWFELPIDGGASREAAQLAVARGILPLGETLSSKLSRRGRARLKKTAARLNLPMAALDRMRPWLADLTLGVAQLAKGGANGSDGVERTLSLSAPATAQRRAFETPEQQIAMFADAPDKEQVKALEHSLREMRNAPKTSGQMIDAWVAGDLKTLERRGLTPMRRNSPGLYRRLVTERNARWTQMLAERLAGSGETVVVVGAAHLIGKDGLPAMLRARGIAVEGP